MINLMLGAALGFLSSFLVFYAYDSGYIWEKERFIRQGIPWMPSLDDIKTPDVDVFKSYVKDAVLPAARYFFIRNDYGLCDLKETGGYRLLIIHVPVFFLSFSGAAKVFPDCNSYVLAIVIIAIQIAIICLTSTLYGKRHSIPEFKLDDHEIERMREEIPTDTKESYISSYCVLNNKVIHLRLAYLEYHLKEIKWRLFARKLVDAVAAVIFLIFIQISE